MHLPAFDYTKLTGINTCPKWGMVTYDAHKVMPGTGRSLALHAGQVCHEVFAAVRVWQLAYVQNMRAVAGVHARKLFGEGRDEQLWATQSPSKSPDTNMTHFALETLHTAGYYDDPRDKRRTLTNMEESLIHYCDRWDCERFPIFTSPNLVGIEVPFDLTLDLGWCRIRYIGRMDGLHWDGDTIVTHENKTAARLDDAWLQSFHMSHQITGYSVAASMLTQQECKESIVYGLSIPLPRKSDFGGYSRESYTRGPHMVRQWAHWVSETVKIWAQYKDNVLAAPTYTHSCNRYFHPCALLPMCTSDEDEQAHMLNVEMEHHQWSPLDER
jgi:hypothetical protein